MKIVLMSINEKMLPEGETLFPSSLDLSEIEKETPQDDPLSLRQL